MTINLLVRAAAILPRATLLLALLRAIPLLAQEPSTADSDAALVAPAQGQITLNAATGFEPPTPLPTELGLKNNRLFYVLANYSTVERHDEFGTLSPKTKFKLSL